MPNLSLASSALSNMAALLPIERFTVETRYTDELSRIAADKEKDEQRKRDAILLLLLLFAFLAYQEGAEQGGTTLQQDQLTLDQRALITAFAVAQTEYAAGLAKAMAEADKADEAVAQANKKLSEAVSETNITPEAKAIKVAEARAEVAEAAAQARKLHDAVDRRIDMWQGTLRTMRAAGLVWAAGSTVATWYYGDSVHCPTCLWLNGQTHPVSWFTERGYLPGVPESNTDCRGWNCKCIVVDARGNRVL